jgi:rifampin ADP-ribosylating transferase
VARRSSEYYVPKGWDPTQPDLNERSDRNPIGVLLKGRVDPAHRRPGVAGYQWPDDEPVDIDEVHIAHPERLDHYPDDLTNPYGLRRLDVRPHTVRMRPQPAKTAATQPWTPAVHVPATVAPKGTHPRDIQVPGVTVRGRQVIDPDDLPDEVYHATTALDAVTQSGHLRAGGVGGLGGDSKDRIVSMTADRQIADEIAAHLRDAATWAREYPDTERDSDERDQANRALIEKMKARAREEGWEFTDTDRIVESYPAHLRNAEMGDLLAPYHWQRKTRTGRPNPIIMTDHQQLRQIDPAQVGVVPVHRDDLRNGALLVDFDRGENHLEEVRSYGDVPLSRLRRTAAEVHAIADELRLTHKLNDRGDQGIVRAFLGDEPVGWLQWTHAPDRDDHGEIEFVEVPGKHHRKGVATRMLEHARSIEPAVHHSTARTDAGAGWAEKTAAAPLPTMRAYEVYEREREGRDLAGITPTLSGEDAARMFHRVLKAEGHPYLPPDERAHTLYRPAEHPRHSALGHDPQTGDPLLVLGDEMRDPWTVLHEAAHELRNGGLTNQELGFETADHSHDEQWVRTFQDLARKHAPVRGMHEQVGRVFHPDFEPARPSRPDWREVTYEHAKADGFQTQAALEQVERTAAGVHQAAENPFDPEVLRRRREEREQERQRRLADPPPLVQGAGAQEIYRREHDLRQFAPLVPLDHESAAHAYRRMMEAEGLGHLLHAEPRDSVVMHRPARAPRGGEGGKTWSAPFHEDGEERRGVGLALHPDMSDELTIAHETAHVVANGGRPGRELGHDHDSAHGPEWLAAYRRLLHTHARPEVGEEFDRHFHPDYQSSVVQGADGRTVYRADLEQATAAVERTAAEVLAAGVRQEPVSKILSEYAFDDAPDWASVRENYNTDVPAMRRMREDIRQNGIQKPISIDYSQDPPRVTDGHTRLLHAEDLGLTHIPVVDRDFWDAHPWVDGQPGDADDPDGSWRRAWLDGTYAALGRVERTAAEVHQAADKPVVVTSSTNSHIDWAHELGKMKKGVHRGMRITLPPELHDLVHDRYREHPDRQARAILDYLRESGGVGMHWTPDERLAHGFAKEDPATGARASEGETSVVLHAATPAPEHIASGDLRDQGVLGFDHWLGGAEREVPLAPDAPVHIKAVTWYQGPRRRKVRGEVWSDGPQHVVGLREVERTAAAVHEAAGLMFVPEETDSGGSKWPTAVKLRAMVGDQEVGYLKYLRNRRGTKLLVDTLQVHPDHQRRGHASALMDELHRQHPDAAIEHGDRTRAGKAWWDRYRAGRPVSRGRVRGAGEVEAAVQRVGAIAAAVPARLVLRYQTQGREGYEERQREVDGPFYHGGRARLGPGGELRPGFKTNPWGDEGPKSTHVHFTTDPWAAAEYARQSGGHLYEVEPTGEGLPGYGGDEFKSKHPLRVVRRVPPEEWPATKQASAPEPPPRPPADEPIQPTVARQTYYHGTYAEGLGEIQPATQHGRAVTFNSDTDPDFAYATARPEDAWQYAQKSYDWNVNRMPRGPFPVPRVYEVEPVGDVEEDPQGRGNYEGDVRSRRPFRVVREVPMPEDVGTPDDYRY